MKHKLKCTACGAELELSIAYTGCDWDSKAGKGSGYNYQITLDCPTEGCGIVYPLGHIKNERDFSEVIEKYKVVK
jgi:hypothetical protein